MAKFRISYEITGSVIVDAPTAEDATAYFEREYSIGELAELGVLEAHEAESEHEGLMRPIHTEDVMQQALTDPTNARRRAELDAVFRQACLGDKPYG